MSGFPTTYLSEMITPKNDQLDMFYLKIPNIKKGWCSTSPYSQWNDLWIPINEQHYMCTIYTPQNPSVMTVSGSPPDPMWPLTSARLIKERHDGMLNSFIRFIKPICESSLLFLEEIDMVNEYAQHYSLLYNKMKEPETFMFDDIPNFKNQLTSSIGSVYYSKIKDTKQREKRNKVEQENKRRNEDYKKRLIKKEFFCVKLLNRLEEQKLLSEEIYTEYNKINQMKINYDKNVLHIVHSEKLSALRLLPTDLLFLTYFDEPKITYLNAILNKVTKK